MIFGCEVKKICSFLIWSWNASAIELLVWIYEKKDLSKMIFVWEVSKILLLMILKWSFVGLNFLDKVGFCQHQHLKWNASASS